MPLGSVKITKPLRRLIYINGNYDESAGQSPGPFAVEYGLNLFETRNGTGRVDWRGTTTITSKTSNVSLDLEQV